MRTRIKICGMTQASQVAIAVDCGVDAIGVILHANSPRAINIEQAQEIRAVIPAFVSLVGVFVNANKETIDQAVQEIGLDLIQLHGEETNEFGRQLNRPFIKAIRAKDLAQIQQDINQYPQANALLFDPYVVGQHGGTGQTLNAELWPQTSSKALVLAGGLSADNVYDRVTQLRPFAVDMNSGLERSPGDKNVALIARAVDSVRLADSEHS